MRRITIDPDRTAAADIVRKLQFSPDGKLLGGVLGQPGWEDVRAWRYDPDRDEPLPNPDDEDYTIERELESPDPVWSDDLELLAEYLIDGSGYPGLRVTDLWSKPLESAWLMFGGEFVPTAFAFSPDGGDLYAACWNERHRPITRWSVEQLLSGADPQNADADEVASVSDSAAALALGARSSWLACGFHNDAVDLIDPTGERLTRRLVPRRETGAEPIRSLQFSPRGDRLLTVCGGTVSVWDVATGDPLLLTPSRDTDAAAFRPDGSLLAVTSRGDVVFYDFACAEVRRLDFGVGPLHGVAVAADGLTAAVGAGGGQVVIFDLD